MSERKTIMLVDDNAANLTIGKNMIKEQYRVMPLPSADMMFELLKNILPDLILLDIEMPDMDGYTALKMLKSRPEWEDIPVIFLTSKTDEKSEYEGLSLGATDYLGKPFSAPLLLKRIENCLFISEQKQKLKVENKSLLEDMIEKNKEILDLQNASLNIVANLVEFRDDVTGGHVMRVQKYLERLIGQMTEDGVYTDESDTWDMDFIMSSAQLHDVGKIGIPDAILNKPDKLTPEEFEIMKTHVTIGVDAIRKMEEMVKVGSFMHHAKLFAGAHHERWDGEGYPNGLKGEDIPLEGRLLAIADVYDALVSKRPYKRPLSTADAGKIIQDGEGSHFDPVLVRIFSKVADRFADIVKHDIY